MKVKSHDDISTNVTISLGVASMDKDNPDEREILKKADAALYDSKRNGKNIVSVYKE